MNRRHAASLAGAFVLGAMGMALADGAAHAAPSSETLRWLRVFGDVLDVAERQFLQPVDTAKAIRGGIEGMVRSLDPHSAYLAPETFATMTGRTPPPASIGIAITETARGLRVTTVLPNGPAADAQMQPGDELLAVDGQFTANLTIDQAASLLRGEPGSTIALSIRRDDRLLDLKLTRRVVAPAPNPAARMIGDVGYLSLASLTENTERDAEAAVRTLKAQNPAMKGFVLDLRNSPGGLLAAAVGVADIFLDGGEVFSQRGRGPRDVERYMARPGDLLNGLPMVVLINSGTASGSEIIAGALQDRHRARLVGLHSFGDGVIQTVIPLAGGRDGALKITTSMFFLPTGRPIQKLGLTPDEAVANSEADAQARFPIGERALAGALDAPGAAPPAVEEPAAQPPPAGYPAKGDYQLDRAVALARNR